MNAFRNRSKYECLDVGWFVAYDYHELTDPNSLRHVWGKVASLLSSLFQIGYRLLLSDLARSSESSRQTISFIYRMNECASESVWPPQFLIHLLICPPRSLVSERVWKPDLAVKKPSTTHHWSVLLFTDRWSVDTSYLWLIQFTTLNTSHPVTTRCHLRGGNELGNPILVWLSCQKLLTIRHDQKKVLKHISIILIWTMINNETGQFDWILASTGMSSPSNLPIDCWQSLR